MTDNQPTPEQYAKLTDLTIEALRQTLVTLRKLQGATTPTRRARLVEEARFYLRVLEHAVPTPTDPADPAGEFDPRTEVEAHWGGDPEQLIAAWEADQAQRHALDVRGLGEADLDALREHATILRRYAIARDLT